MAVHALHDQFVAMQHSIALGDRALLVIAAHTEVGAVLRASDELRGHGLDAVLIGSYARRVMNWPGKDVDVFGRLLGETVDSMTPGDAYEAFGRALEPFADEGRLTSQPRSFKVDYGPDRVPRAAAIRSAGTDYGWGSARVANVLRNRQQLAFEFSVDVVPAVVWDRHFGIPETNQNLRTGARHRTGHWRQTDPVQLIQLTRTRNRDQQVMGQGAFVRTVKAIRQAKTNHLSKTRPSSLFYEFMLHEGFDDGSIFGDSWADITASALSFIAERLGRVSSEPVLDPALGDPYNPIPDQADLGAARSVFDSLAGRARHAVTTEQRCQAAIEWRHIFGVNERAGQVFPLPPGCRGTGVAMGVGAANEAVGGTGERGFGGV